MDLKLRLISIAGILALLSFSSFAGSSLAYAEGNTFSLDELQEQVIRNSREMANRQISTDRVKYRYQQAEKDYEKREQPSSYDAYSRVLAEVDLQSDYIANLNPADPDYQAKLNEATARKAILDRSANDAHDRFYKDVQKRDDLRKSMNKAEENYRDAQVALKKYESELKHNVTQSYTDILLQENKLILLEREINLKKTLLEMEQKRLELGLSTKEAVESLALDYDNAQKSLSDAKHALRNSKGDLNLLAGRDFDARLNLQPLAMAEIALWIEEKLPDYEELLLKSKKEYVKFDQLYRDIKDLEEEIDDIDSTDDNYTEYRADLLRLDIKELQLQIKNENISLEQTVNNAIVGLETKIKNYELNKVEFEKTKRQHEWNQKKFDLGQLSYLKLRQSEQNYLNAKQKILANEYDILLARSAIALLEQGIIVRI